MYHFIISIANILFTIFNNFINIFLILYITCVCFMRRIKCIEFNLAICYKLDI